MNDDTAVTASSPPASEQSGMKAKDFKRLTRKYAESCSDIIGRENKPYKELEIELESILPPESVAKFAIFIDEAKAQYKKDLRNVAANLSEGLEERLNILDDMIEEAKRHERVKAQLIPTPAQVNRGVLYKEKLEQLRRLQQIYAEETDKARKLVEQVKTLKEKSDTKAELTKSVASKLDQYVKTAQEISADFANSTRND